MFERFTDRARRAVVLSQDEARTLGHNWIGTEHILLGLAREGEGVAGQALVACGHTYESLRAAVEDRIGASAQSPVTGHIPYTPRSKRVLELALREALQLGHNYVGTEHMLLGLVREGQGVGAQVLGDLPPVRQAVLELLSQYAAANSPTPAPPNHDSILIKSAAPDTPAVARIRTAPHFRGYRDIELALEEAFNAGRAASTSVPERVRVRIKSLDPPGALDSEFAWVARVENDGAPGTHGDVVYAIEGDPNAVAIGRHKASLRKFIGCTCS